MTPTDLVSYYQCQYCVRLQTHCIQISLHYPQKIQHKIFTYSLEKFNMNSEEVINLKGNTLNTGCYPVFLFMSVMTKQWVMYNSRVFSVVSMCEQNTESKR